MSLVVRNNQLDTKEEKNMELNTNRANLLDPSTVVDEDTCLTAGEVNDVMREIFQDCLLYTSRCV